MNHRSVQQLDGLARVVPEGADPVRAVRRARLERFAGLLDGCKGKLRLLTRIEYIPRSARESMRMEDSPLTIAYADPVFRAQGLASDRLGDAMRFFALTSGETHHLFCDCHYGSTMVWPGAVAQRVRTVAQKQSLGELWLKVRRGLAALWQG